MRGPIRSVLVALAGLATVASTGAWTIDEPSQPGVVQETNLKHVFNYAFPTQRPDDQGTDLEFFTSTVPLRDYATGEKVLDEAGNPILAERDFAVVGSYNDQNAPTKRGAFVFDITDPENVRFVRLIVCNQGQNDVQLKKFTDATTGAERWILALAKDNSASYGPTTCLRQKNNSTAGAGIALFDVTDPYEAEPMYSVFITKGAHNFTFHPTKPYGYVSTGDLPGGQNVIPIVDFTNPDAATVLKEIPVEGGPHDIAFSPDGNRAYVASENNSRIYDTTDPVNPVLLSRSVGPANYHHGFEATPDGKVSVLTDESLVFGGFFVSGTTVCPGGGLTFYSIEGDRERNPVPLGFFEADVQGRGPDHRACTGHVGKIAPNSRVLVTGWYIGGVRVVDFSNPSLPKEVASIVMPETEVWAAKFYKGPYIYAADLGRGFDVYRWSGTGEAPWVAP